MLTDIKIEAEARTIHGKKASRKLARQGLVPGVIYGGAGAPETFQIDPRRLEAVLHSRGGMNTLFSYSTKGGRASTMAIIKEYLSDPATGKIIHADLMRIAMDKAIEVKVPVRITGTAPGVKNQGGILDLILREIQVSCLPGDIPDDILADVSELELGRGLKVESLPVPDKVKVLTDKNKMVAVVVAPAAEKSAEAAAAEAAAVTEGAAEPEVIKRGKAETAEGAEAAAPAAGKKEEKPEKGAGKK